MKATLQSPTTRTANSSSFTDAPQSGPDLIKKKELARRLSVSPHTIDGWVQRREIPFIAVTPRLYLYEPDAVLEAIRKKYRIEVA